MFYADNVSKDVILTKKQIQFLQYQGRFPKACKGAGKWYVFVNMHSNTNIRKFLSLK